MDAESLLRRYLEQRRDVGERDLVLDHMTVEEVMRIIGATARGASRGPEPLRPRADVERAERADAAPPPQDDAPRERARDGHQPAAASSSASDEAPPASAPAPARGLEAAGDEAELFGGPISRADSLDEIATMVAKCTRCPLYKTATNPVPGEGSPHARLMCIGEAPGATEDQTGRPFVGAAGQLLTKILAAIQLTRDDVFITNVLKHRPPGNRNPMPDEVTACRPYLVRQIELIRPAVLVAFGTFAAQSLLDTKLSLGKLRGTVHRYRGIPLVVTYHPAALLRNPAWKRPTWEDVQLARRLLDSASA
ncbi:MAG TPA: uracil-DNA glycosylase [Gemmatimonadaceae bacterium]|nr:uracil-DNA glycosylase [Gemmatimonadaceae bacterium]